MSQYHQEILDLESSHRYFAKGSMALAKQILNKNPHNIEKYIESVDQYFASEGTASFGLAMGVISYANQLGMSLESVPDEIRTKARESYEWFLKQAFYYAREKNLELAKVYLIETYRGIKDLGEIFYFENEEYTIHDFKDAVSKLKKLILADITGKPVSVEEERLVNKVVRMTRSIVLETGENLL